MKQRKEIAIGGGTLVIETGHLAKQADGSCVVRYGDTVVLATACMDTKVNLERDFLPLTVDYKEYTYAAGRIPGGFFKREGRPTEKEIITSRLIDRPLRPLFPEGYVNETQIIAFVMSADEENDPDILAINGASIALVLSEIPFYHPIAAVRVGLIDGEILINPTNSQRDVSDLDLIVAGTEEAVVMVEAGANQVSEEIMLEAIWRAHVEIQKIIKVQHELYREGTKTKPSWTAPEAYPDSLYQQVRGDLYASLKGALFTKKKHERKDAVNGVVKPYIETIPAEEPAKRTQV
ncbi:MAG TPA: polyribonucleotide nucleotidyltransferase, partial [Thermoanaerobaculia bacterium]|nr:polyribonucleotide nucleotidyltransferase [Thermoanaerobaculia bacterium]